MYVLMEDMNRGSNIRVTTLDEMQRGLFHREYLDLFKKEESSLICFQ